MKNKKKTGDPPNLTYRVKQQIWHYS